MKDRRAIAGIYPFWVWKIWGRQDHYQNRRIKQRMGWNNWSGRFYNGKEALLHRIEHIVDWQYMTLALFYNSKPGVPAKLIKEFKAKKVRK